MLLLHFDGLCEDRNPGGLACYGWTLHGLTDRPGGTPDRQEIDTGHGFICRGPSATNNTAEWCALGFGLRYLLDRRHLVADQELRIFGDSQLVVFQLTKKWQCNAPHLLAYRQRCWDILQELGRPWHAQWIPREQNTEADALSNRAYFEQTGKNPPPAGHQRRRRVRRA